MQGSNGAWNPFIDFVVFRYYIDGEETPSIEFSPNMACGVGPFANRTGTTSTPPNPAVGPHRLDPQAGGRPTDGNPMGPPQAHAPWTAKYFGKGSADGGWYTDVRVPFGKKIRVTTQLPPVPGHPEITAVRCFIQVRGVENLPLSIGGVAMPPTARLHLQKIDGRVYPPLSWVNLLDVPTGRGAVLANTLAFESASQNTLEGCIHAYSPHSTPFPGIIVATGTEDYCKRKQGCH